MTVAVVDSQRTMQPGAVRGNAAALESRPLGYIMTSRCFEELTKALKRLVICMKIVGQ